MSSPTSEYRTSREGPVIAALTAKVGAWLIPALVGALLTLLFNISGDRAIAAQTLLRVDKLEVEVKEIEKELAAGGPPALARRVDDLQAQTQQQYMEVSKKLDVIQELLLKRK